MLLYKPYIVADFDQDPELNSDKRINFSYIESDIVHSKKRLSNGLWIETNKAADGCDRSSRLILKKCGFNPDALIVELKEE
jgi:hypothetical protein